MRKKTLTARQQELAVLPLFGALSPGELAHVDRLVDDVELLPGDVLTKEGQPGRQAFIVMNGEADVTVGGRTVTKLGAGEVIGEMSLIDHRPQTATVVARTPMRVLVLDPRSFAELLDDGHIGRKVLASVVARLRSTDQALVRT